MQIIELEIGETVTLAPGIRVTVLEILPDRVRLEIDAPPHVTITVAENAEEGTGVEKN
jgi:sRNA-binding carbon storage regulator CsrA